MPKMASSARQRRFLKKNFPHEAKLGVQRAALVQRAPGLRRSASLRQDRGHRVSGGLVGRSVNVGVEIGGHLDRLVAEVP